MYLAIYGIEAKTLLTLSDLMIPFRINKLFQLDKLALAYSSESIHTQSGKNVEYLSPTPQVYWALEI